MNPIARLLIFLGISLVAGGLLWQVASRYGIPIGKLPGDIAIQKENVKFYFPVTTSILLSVLLSFVLYVIRKFTQ